ICLCRAVCSPSFLIKPIRFFNQSMLLMRMFGMLPGVFCGVLGVVQYIACGRWVQGVSSVLIRKIRRKRTYMFLSFVEKQCAPA
ncbi:hypothetical protein ACJV2P_26565, partial [Escherichia coli]|uniref:hypothetical protein n=1 Tax=Escherichia coli TaxID=562 RepID=UPI00387EF174